MINSTNSFKLIKKFAERILDFNIVDENKKTTLMYAAQSNIDVRVTKYFIDNLKNTSDINLKNENELTAVMYAARYNPNPLILVELLARGADISPNSKGLTLAMLASCNPNHGVLKSLISQAEDLDLNAIASNGKTALIYACENSQNIDVIKLLVDNNADVNIKDLDGKTAIDYSQDKYKTSEVSYLLTTASKNNSIGEEISSIKSDNEEVKNSNFEENTSDLPSENDASLEIKSELENVESISEIKQ